MNEKNKSSKFIDSIKEVDLLYYIGFGIGLIALILTLVLVSIFKGEDVTWTQIIFYPLLVYFIFQQVLSGFGFITGYIPIGSKIIKRLTKSAKKKAYSEKDVKYLEKFLDELELREKNVKNDYDKLEKKLNTQYKKLNERETQGFLAKRRASKQLKNVEKKKRELKNEREKFDNEMNEEKEKLRAKLKRYRGRLEEKVVKKQEEMDPKRFKLILLVPIYVMMIIGIVLSVFFIIKAIIVWPGDAVPASQILQNIVDALDVLDIINEYYKGIIAGVTITTFYIIPAIKLIKNPEKEVAPQVFQGRRRKISDWWKRRVTKDTRTLLNRQFEDLRRYYYDIKQIIGRSLLIPIGLSQLIVAPIGGLSVVLGIKSGIKREKLKRYENVFLVIVAVSLIAILAVAYFSFFAKEIKSMHSALQIIMKLIYISFLVVSFYLFTRQPIAKRDEL
ncbi:MAG TPA: hypothetical protein VMX55_01475 [candidate division Zixibacteria bacterium]|nr:hypothetical protein [candidate division Zixibacteria bacterium]